MASKFVPVRGTSAVPVLEQEPPGSAVAHAELTPFYSLSWSDLDGRHSSLVASSERVHDPPLQDLSTRFGCSLESQGSIVAVLTLALGIGANTAIFTVVNAIVLKPLPYGAPDRLVMVWQDLRARGGPDDEWLTPGNYADLRNAADVVEGIAVMSGWRPALTGLGETAPIPGEQCRTTSGLLGVAPALGRNFTPQDDVPNAPRVVIVSDGFRRDLAATAVPSGE